MGAIQCTHIAIENLAMHFTWFPHTHRESREKIKFALSSVLAKGNSVSSTKKGKMKVENIGESPAVYP